MGDGVWAQEGRFEVRWRRGGAGAECCRGAGDEEGGGGEGRCAPWRRGGGGNEGQGKGGRDQGSGEARLPCIAVTLAARVRAIACSGPGSTARDEHRWLPGRARACALRLPVQAQENGEALALQDEASYALDGLRADAGLATQRDALLQLGELLSTRRGRVALR